MLGAYLSYTLRESWRRRRLVVLLLIGLSAMLAGGLLVLGEARALGATLIANLRLLQVYLLFPLALLGGLALGRRTVAEITSPSWRSFGPTRLHGAATPLGGMILGVTLGVFLVLFILSVIQGLLIWLFGGLTAGFNPLLPLQLLPAALFAACLGGLCASLREKAGLTLGLTVLAVAYYAPLLWSKLQFGLPALRPLMIELLFGARFQTAGLFTLATVQLLLYCLLFFFLSLFRINGDWYAPRPDDGR